VSKRRQVLAKLQSLRDLGDVFGAMKNLALVEISRLAASARAREHLREELAAVARATTPVFVEGLGDGNGRDDLHVVIGSERGFCGAFNEPLVEKWRALAASKPEDRAIVVGSALVEELAGTAGVAMTLQGPTIAEDIDETLMRVLEAIRTIQDRRKAPMGVKAIWTAAGGVAQAAILPFAPPVEAILQVPPEFFLPHETFVRDFIDQYVDAVLHEAFCASLMAESRERVAHMTGALQHVDERCAQLQQRANRLRQEEITDTIETILLSTRSK
jgi:F-type H+-transporting ATPase subunit gamma